MQQSDQLLRSNNDDIRPLQSTMVLSLGQATKSKEKSKHIDWPEKLESKKDRNSYKRLHASSKKNCKDSYNKYVYGLIYDKRSFSESTNPRVLAFKLLKMVDLSSWRRLFEHKPWTYNSCQLPRGKITITCHHCLVKKSNLLRYSYNIAENTWIVQTLEL